MRRVEVTYAAAEMVDEASEQTSRRADSAPMLAAEGLETWPSCRVPTGIEPASGHA